MIIKHYINNKERILKLFKTSGNTLSFYKNPNNGLVDEIRSSSEFKIQVSDIKKNNIYILIPINNEKNIIEKKIEKKSNVFYNKLIDDNLEFNFKIRQIQNKYS